MYLWAPMFINNAENMGKPVHTECTIHLSSVWELLVA